MPTIKELREQAKALNITGYGSMGKKELRLAVERAESAEFAQWLKDAAEGKTKISWSAPTLLFGNTDNSQAKETPAVVDYEPEFDEVCYIPDYQPMTAVLDDVPEARDIVPSEPNTEQSEQDLAPTFIAGQEYYYYHETKKYKHSMENYICGKIRVVSRDKNSICILPLSGITKHRRNNDTPYRVKLLNDKHGEYFNPDSSSKQFICYASSLVTLKKECTFNESIQAFKQKHGDYIRFEIGKQYIPEDNANYPSFEVISRDYEALTFGVPLFDTKELHSADFGVTTDKQGRKTEYIKYSERYEGKLLPTTTIYASNVLPDDDPAQDYVFHIAPAPKPEPVVAQVKFIVGEQYSIISKTNGVATYKVISRAKKTVNLSWLKLNGTWSKDTWACKIVDIIDGQEVLQFPEKFFELPIYLHAEKDHISEPEARIIYAEKKNIADKATDTEPSHEDTAPQACSLLPVLPDKISIHYLLLIYCTEKNYLYAALIHAITRCWQAIRTSTPKRKKSRLQELREEAKALGIKGYSKMNIEKLSEAICEVKYYPIARAEDIQRKALEQPEAITPEVLPPTPAPVQALPEPAENFTITGTLSDNKLSMPKNITQPMIDAVLALYLSYNEWRIKQNHYRNLWDYLIESRDVTVPKLRKLANLFGYSIAKTLPGSKKQVRKHSIANAVYEASIYIHDTYKQNREKSIAVAFPYGTLELPLGLDWMCDNANMRNSFRINKCKTPQELEALLSASAFSYNVLEFICRYYGITNYKNMYKHTHKELISRFLVHKFPEVVMHSPALSVPALPALPAHASTPEEKPHTAPKKRSKANHTNLTMQNVEACYSREALTALFSNFSIVDITNFMLRYGVSLRPLLGTKAIKANKAGIINYCVSKILFERNAGINHSPILDVEAYLDGKKLSFRAVNHNRKAVNL